MIHNIETTQAETYTSVELEALWKSVLNSFDSYAPKPSWRFWLSQLTISTVETTGSTVQIFLIARNDFVRKKIETEYREALSSILKHHLGNSIEVKISVEENQIEGETKPTTVSVVKSDSTSLNAKDPPVTPGLVTRVTHASVSQNRTTPGVRYTFGNYVVAENNDLAYRAALKVTELGPRKYNPFFIHSQPGLGKTHLLRAMVDRLSSTNDSSRIRYIPGEAFLTEAVDSMQNRKMGQFRKKYRFDCDYLLIDGIEFIAGRQKTEDEFFQTFDTLCSHGRQVIIASEQPPGKLLDLSDRLRTRFESGLIADLKKPNFATRIRILQSKADEEDIFLPDEVARYLATIFCTNVRELEGALVRLEAQSSLFGQEISFELTRSIFGVTASGFEPLIPRILRAVSEHFQIEPGDFKRRTRIKKIVTSRHIAAYLIRKHTKSTFKEIAKEFGNQDHSSVVHGATKIESLLVNNEEIKTTVERIERLLGELSSPQD